MTNVLKKTQQRSIFRAVVAFVLAVMVMAIPTKAFGAATEKPITSVNIPTSITIKVGETRTLTVGVNPSNTTYKTNIEWGTQTNNAFTSKANGFGTYWKQPSSETLNGKKVGKGYLYTTVKVYDSKGRYVRSYKVTTTVNVVSASKPATVSLRSISLNQSALKLSVGSNYKLTVSYNPSNTTVNRSVSWKTSNSAIATVSNGIVTAKKPGTVTITATSGGKTASCKLTVTAPLKSISLNRTSATLTEGQTLKLTVSYNPTNTTDGKSVSWKSSNNSIATVSNGTVTAKKPGTVTITATCGGKTATCKITINAKPSSGSPSSSPRSSSTTNPSSSAATGTYRNVTDAYTYLNNFRTTRTNQWYWNSNNTAKVTTYGLGTLRRDTSLENTAKLRAQEAWIMYYERGQATHNRPNGTSCFTAFPSGVTTRGENLAWGHTSSYTVIMDGSEGWAETNAKYAGQGHRRNMLDARFTRVGIACYEKDGKTCWAMCLGS